MTINVYPSLLPGRPIETYEFHGGTVGDWLHSVGIEYEKKPIQPVQVSINGADVPYECWVNRAISSSDQVDIKLRAHGGAFNSVMNFIRKTDPILNWVMKSMTPRINNNSQQSGVNLETVEANANEAKLGAVVPELAGRFIRYPEYLTPPHRYFENMRTQRLQFLACVGPGTYAYNDEDVKIGDTPFSTIGDDAEYHIYPPGTDLVGDFASEHWHTANEVGGTSSGTPGLELSTESANRDNVDPASYIFDWDDIQRTEGEWPSGWGPGSNVQVEFPVPYEVVTINVPPTEFDPGYSISEITGWFHHFPNATLAAGQIIGLGPLGAVVDYQIRSITPEATTGIYTVRLEDPVTQAPVLLTPGAAVVLRFGSDLSRNIYGVAGEDTIQVAPGRFHTMGDPLVAAGAKVRYLDGLAYGEWSIEVVATPGNEVTGQIAFDVFFPRGLVYMAGDGDLEPRSVTVQFQYRDIDTGVRTTEQRTYTQATLDQIGFTEYINIDPAPRIRASCRMRRITANSTSTQIQDTCHWYGLKARLPIKTVYPNWTTMSVSLRSGGRIAAQSENQINLVATRQLPELNPDDTWTAPQATRQISAFFRHILNTIGIADDQIDMEELQRLHAIWYTRGETCDHVFDETTVKEALNLVLGAGMAELTIANGLIKPVRDDVRTQFEQGYSPQNMTTPLRRAFRSPKPGDTDGVEVEYTDEATWTKKVIPCRLPGDQGFKVERLKVSGVTDRTRAWRIGMRRRRVLRYRRWEYSFGTELDALNSEYLSYVPLVDDIPGHGKSSILEHIEASGGLALLHVSEPMTWEEGQDHVVGYRMPDGTVAGPFAAQPGPDEYSILADIPQPWPVVTLKHEPPHVYFGTTDEWCFPALITDISPNGNQAASVKGENYDVRVYASDNEFPPT